MQSPTEPEEDLSWVSFSQFYNATEAHRVRRTTFEELEQTHPHLSQPQYEPTNMIIETTMSMSERNDDTAASLMAERTVKSKMRWTPRNEEEDAEFCNLKLDIKTVLIIQNQGIPVEKAYEIISELIDVEIPYQKFGFRNFFEFLYHCDDILEIRTDGCNGYYIFLRGEAGNETEHLRALVIHQKKQCKGFKATLASTTSVSSDILLNFNNLSQPQLPVGINSQNDPSASKTQPNFEPCGVKSQYRFSHVNKMRRGKLGSDRRGCGLGFSSRRPSANKNYNQQRDHGSASNPVVAVWDTPPVPVSVPVSVPVMVPVSVPIPVWETAPISVPNIDLPGPSCNSQMPLSNAIWNIKPQPSLRNHCEPSNDHYQAAAAPVASHAAPFAYSKAGQNLIFKTPNNIKQRNELRQWPLVGGQFPFGPLNNANYIDKIYKNLNIDHLRHQTEAPIAMLMRYWALMAARLKK